MPRPQHKSGCSVFAGILLLVVVLVALGCYFIWRVDSTGYAPEVAPPGCVNGTAPQGSC